MRYRNPNPTPHIRLILAVFVVVLALALTGVNYAFGAEYFPSEPKASEYTFSVPSQCPASVKDAMAVSAHRFSAFLPVSVVDGSLKGVIYDGVDSVTCGTFPPELRLSDCWNDRGLLACSEDVTSQTSNAVVGRATWWRETDTAKEILECDIQIDPGAEALLIVAMHEAGHCAGLAHSYAYRSGLMYPNLSALMLGFHWFDIMGLCHLYGCEDAVVDDYGNVFIPRAVKAGDSRVWFGVVAGKHFTLIDRVE